MKPRERAAIYSLLALILAANAVVLLGRAGTPAFGAVSEWLDTLGPADNVILKGEPPLTIVNSEGRIAWTDTAHARAYSIAFVDATRLLGLLLETDQYHEEQERLRQRIEAEELEWRQKEQEIMQKYDGITQDDPRLPEAQAEYSEVVAQYQEWRNLANQEVNQLAVEQLRRGYQEVGRAVDVISDQVGIDIVFKFTPPGAEFPEGLSSNTMFDIHLRSVVRYPDSLDITEKVREEMGLPAE